MRVGFLHHLCQLSYNCKLDEFEPPKLASYMGCLGHLMAVHLIEYKLPSVHTNHHLCNGSESGGCSDSAPGLC